MSDGMGIVVWLLWMSGFCLTMEYLMPYAFVFVGVYVHRDIYVDICSLLDILLGW